MTERDQRLHRAVVMFSAGDWWIHSHGHADMQLAQELVRTDRRVIVVNSMGLGIARVQGRSTAGRIRRKLRSMLRPFSRLETGMIVLSPLFVPAFGNGWAARANSRVVAIQVALVISLLRLGVPHVIVANPTSTPVAQLLRSRTRTFYRVDDYSEAAEADRNKIELLVRSSINWSERVLYSSQSLFDRESQQVPTKAIRFPHGVDLALFDPTSPATEPPDLAGIPRPHLGHVGNLEDHDRQLQIAEVAALLPEFQFILIGHSDEVRPELVRPNVHLLGKRPHEQIPAYLKSFDTALLFVPRNQWGAAAEPVKVKEYLAMGVPVVANDFVGWERFAGVIRVGSDAEGVAAEIRRTLQDGGPTDAIGRANAVAGDGWAARAAELLELLGEGNSDNA